MYTGHSLVKVFGRQDEAREAFARAQRRAVRAAASRRSSSPGIIQPAHDVHRQHQLRAGRGRRRAAGGIGRYQPRRRAGVHPVLPPVQPAADPGRVAWPTCSSPVWRRPSGCFELLDAAEEIPDPVPGRAPDRVSGRVVFENVSFRYDPDRPLIERPRPGRRAGPDRGDRRADRSRQDDAGQPADALLRRGQRRRSRSTASTSGRCGAGAARRLRHGAAGHLAVRRDDPREHRLRGGPARPRGPGARRRRTPHTSTTSSAPCPTATRRSSTTRART